MHHFNNSVRGLLLYLYLSILVYKCIFNGLHFKNVKNTCETFKDKDATKIYRKDKFDRLPTEINRMKNKGKKVAINL